jgi:hypothetical protein
VRIIVTAIAAFFGISASLSFEFQQSNQDLLRALRSLDGRIESVNIQRRLPSASGEELILAYGDGKQVDGLLPNPRYFVLLARDLAGVQVLGSALE